MLFKKIKLINTNVPCFKTLCNYRAEPLLGNIFDDFIEESSKSLPKTLAHFPICLQASHSRNPAETLTIENARIPAPKTAISSPCKGRTAKLAPKPRTAARPTPQDAHPGTSTPKNTPTPARKPVFVLLLSLISLALYTSKLISIPVKMPRITIAERDLVGKTELKPIDTLNRNFSEPKNPRVLKKEVRLLKFAIITFSS